MDYGFFNACYYKDTSIILKKIEKGANDWNNGLYGACLGGRIDIANLIIEKVREHTGSEEFDWNTCLFFACKGGYIDMVNFVIEKGANFWYIGLIGACHYGQMNTALLMIKKESEMVKEVGKEIDWGNCLYHAYAGKHYDMAQLMIEKGADLEKLINPLDYVLQINLVNNYEECIKYIKEKKEKKELVDKMDINDCANIVRDYLWYNTNLK